MIVALLISMQSSAQMLTETSTATWFIFPQGSGAPLAGWTTNPLASPGWIAAGIDPCTWAPSVSGTSQRLLGSTFTAATLGTAYFYTQFAVVDISDITTLTLRYNVDDNATFWLNGTVISVTGPIAGGSVVTLTIPANTLTCGVNTLAVQLTNTIAGCFFVQADLTAVRRAADPSSHHHFLGCGIDCDTIEMGNHTLLANGLGGVTWNDGSTDTTRVFCATGKYIATTTVNGCVDIDTFNITMDPCCDTCNWKLTGNSITAGRNILGTLSNDNIRIFSNGSQRGVITNTGNLGWSTIWPMTPTAKFHVNVSGQTLTDGVRLEGLLANQDANVLTVDAQGNVHYRSYPTAGVTSICSTLNFVPKVSTVTGTLSCSQIFDNGNSVGINTTGGFAYTSLAGARLGTLIPPAAGTIKFEVNGVARSLANIVTSDAKFKSNIQSIPDAIEIVKLLSGKTYTWNQNAQQNLGADNGRHIGYLAQELQEIIPEVVITDNEGNLGVNYNEIIPVLSEAIKAQQKRIEQLEAQILTHKSAAPTGFAEKKETTFEGGFLAQNVPNPFSAATEIKYQLPTGTQKASIGIYDMNGKEIKLIVLSSEMSLGSVMIQGGDLQPGMYMYSLLINGQYFDSKKMVLTSQ